MEVVSAEGKFTLKKTTTEPQQYVKRIWTFLLLIWPQCLADFVAYRIDYVDICWLTKWMNDWITTNFQAEWLKQKA